MKFIYLTAVFISLAAIVTFGHTKLYASSMCVAQTESLNEALGGSLTENKAYNFLEVVDRSIN